MNFLFGCSIKIGTLQMLIGYLTHELVFLARVSYVIEVNFVSFSALIQLHTAAGADTRFGVLTSH